MINLILGTIYAIVGITLIVLGVFLALLLVAGGLGLVGVIAYAAIASVTG